MRWAIAGLFVFLLSFQAHAETKVTRDITYGREKLQKLDVYHPASCTSCPVVIWVHGGGWTNGDKTAMGGEDGTKIGALWSASGAVVVSINYRLTPQVRHPAHVQDVAAAINWVYRNISKFGGTPDRIYLLGHSAGAHLVALVATDPNYLQAYGLAPSRNLSGVFPIDSAAYDLQDDLNTPLVGKRVADAFGTDRAALRAASPYHQVRRNGSYPPFIIATAKQHPHGEESMTAFARRLQAAGTTVETLVIDYPGQRAFKAHSSIAKDLYNPSSPMTIRLLGFMGLTVSRPH